MKGLKIALGNLFLVFHSLNFHDCQVQPFGLIASLTQVQLPTILVLKLQFIPSVSAAYVLRL